MGGAVGIDDVDAAGKAEAGMSGGMSVEAACAVDAVDGYRYPGVITYGDLYSGNGGDDLDFAGSVELGEVGAGAGPALIGFIAPDVFGHFGVVDERVAVFLVFVDGVIAVTFLFADGVLAVPFEQKLHCPRGEGGIAVMGKHVALPG